jgi:hypothetical protein
MNQQLAQDYNFFHNSHEIVINHLKLLLTQIIVKNAKNIHLMIYHL